MNYLRQPEKTPSAPKRDDLSAEGEEEKKEKGAGDSYGFADTGILCTVQKHLSSCCSLFHAVSNTLTHTGSSHSIIRTCR